MPPLTATSLYFLEKDQLFNSLTSKNDKFFDSFFDYDLYARQIKSVDDYFEKIKSSVSLFTQEEKGKLQKCCEESDKYLMSLGLTYPGFDGVKASNIKWKFGKVIGKLYEYGLAHTRFNDLIILSNQNISDDFKTLTRTLIHEKIHLYQKQYPRDIEMFLQQNNIIRLKKREYTDFIRANPDLDQWVYKDQTTGFVFKCEYNSKFPKNILDVKNLDQLFEHPFEKMAVDISHKKN